MAEELTKTELVEKIVKLIPNLDRHYLQSQNSIEQLKVMLKAHEHLLEELKPENYLSSRENANRGAVKNIWWVWDTIWRKITGQKEIPEKYELIFPLTITMIFMVLLISFISLTR